MSGGLELIGVGDLAFQRPPSRDAQQRVARWRAGWGTSAQALAFGNLEIPLTARGAPADKPVAFRGDPAGAAALREMGFDVLSLANNHALDYGPEGLRDTMAGLEEAGVAHVGAGVDAASLRAELREVGGTTVALLALCSAMPRGYAAGDRRLGVAPLRAHQSIYVDGALFDEQPGTAPKVMTWPFEDDLARAEATIAALKRDGVDVVALAVHWGVPPMWMSPYQGELADYQRPMAERLVAAGADVLFGHHPHVPHSWSWIDGRPVFWSLGNFLFQPYRVEHAQEGPTTPGLLAAARPPETREGLVARVRFEGGTPAGVDLETFVLDETGEPCAPDAARHAAIRERLRRPDEDAAGVPVRWSPIGAQGNA